MTENATYLSSELTVSHITLCWYILQHAELQDADWVKWGQMVHGANHLAQIYARPPTPVSYLASLAESDRK